MSCVVSCSLIRLCVCAFVVSRLVFDDVCWLFVVGLCLLIGVLCLVVVVCCWCPCFVIPIARFVLFVACRLLVVVC